VSPNSNSQAGALANTSIAVIVAHAVSDATAKLEGEWVII